MKKIESNVIINQRIMKFKYSVFKAVRKMSMSKGKHSWVVNVLKLLSCGMIRIWNIFKMLLGYVPNK